MQWYTEKGGRWLIVLQRRKEASLRSVDHIERSVVLPKMKSGKRQSIMEDTEKLIEALCKVCLTGPT